MIPKKFSSQLLKRWKRQLTSHPLLIRFLLILIIVGLLLIAGYQTTAGWLHAGNYGQLIRQSLVNFFDPTQALAQTQGQTHILILGKGGAGHEAPQLTDSLLVITLDLKSGHTWLLSLPRDIWIPSLRAKLNTAYYYGEVNRPGGGLTLAKAAVSEVTDLPIHYALVIDFSGFVKLIDLLGGIDINVSQAFDDYRYPIPGQETAEPESTRYEHLHFDAGWQHMDGNSALKFVRSRNAEGSAGTDLARSERQKQVLLAIKDKLFSTKVILNRNKLLELQAIIGSSLETDIAPQLYTAFTRLALKFKSQNLTSLALPIYLDDNHTPESSASALLINPPISARYDYQWVLVPKSNNFQDIHQYLMRNMSLRE